MPITTSSFHSLLQHIRICLLSLLFQDSPYSSQQLFDNCSTQLRKLRMVKLPTVGQADRTSTIMVAFMPQRSMSPVRCASTSAESYWAWKHTPLHTPTLYSICNAKSRDLHRLSIFCHFVLFIYHSIKCEIIIRSGRKSNPT